MVFCRCGREAVIVVSSSSDNPGRRGYHCSAHCGFICWVNEDVEKCAAVNRRLIQHSNEVIETNRRILNNNDRLLEANHVSLMSNEKLQNTIVELQQTLVNERHMHQLSLRRYKEVINFFLGVSILMVVLLVGLFVLI